MLSYHLLQSGNLNSCGINLLLTRIDNQVKLEHLVLIRVDTALLYDLLAVCPRWSRRERSTDTDDINSSSDNDLEFKSSFIKLYI